MGNNTRFCDKNLKTERRFFPRKPIVTLELQKTLALLKQKDFKEIRLLEGLHAIKNASPFQKSEMIASCWFRNIEKRKAILSLLYFYKKFYIFLCSILHSRINFF